MNQKKLSQISAAVLACGLLGPIGVTAAAGQGGERPCRAPSEITRIDQSLAATARRITDAAPLKIVAIGSSSTAGAGASSSAASYPSQLEHELRQRFPGRKIQVLNRGVNGETAVDMLARFDLDVVGEKPHLVLWQVGSNTVLRDEPQQPAGRLIRDGVRRIKAAGADVILINPQFAPKIITKHDFEGMIGLIDAAAKENNVSVFRRFSVMRHWRESQGLAFDIFLSADELHMNDWSYGCIAKLLGAAIAEAATRPVTAVSASTRP